MHRLWYHLYDHINRIRKHNKIQEQEIAFSNAKVLLTETYNLVIDIISPSSEGEQKSDKKKNLKNNTMTSFQLNEILVELINSKLNDDNLLEQLDILEKQIIDFAKRNIAHISIDDSTYQYQKYDRLEELLIQSMKKNSTITTPKPKKKEYIRIEDKMLENDLDRLDIVEREIQTNVAKWNEFISLSNTKPSVTRASRPTPQSIVLISSDDKIFIEVDNEHRLSKAAVSLISTKLAYRTSREILMSRMNQIE
jgi:hypothetical protein